TISFKLQDVTAPRVTSTTVLGRFVVVAFNKAMNGPSINHNTLLLVRIDPSGNVILNADPRLMVGYDAANQRAIMDLRLLDQPELPSGHYQVIALDSITDLGGNRLDGEFTGVYPSGNGVAGGNFVLDLPNQVLMAPTVLSIGLAPQSDSGILNDGNTNVSQPT